GDLASVERLAQTGADGVARSEEIAVEGFEVEHRLHVLGVRPALLFGHGASNCCVPTRNSRYGTPRSACGSRGNPRPRSPMRFFCTSSVPPPMRLPKLPSADLWSCPCSGASRPSSIVSGPMTSNARSRDIWQMLETYSLIIEPSAPPACR